jgi:Protein of unknown function (DUF2786)
MTIERDSVLNKIRALLAKTMENGCSEAEAMAALGKAQAMKDAYAVTEGELNLTKEEKAILRREPPGTKDPHRIKWFLTAAVSKFCNCRCWRERRGPSVLRPAIGCAICDLAARHLGRFRAGRDSQFSNGGRAQQRRAPPGDQRLCPWML